MVVTSLGRCSIVVGTASESLSLGTIYDIPSLRVSLMSCSSLDEKRVVRSTAKGHCDLNYRAALNSLLVSVPRSELDGLFLGHVQLPRK